MTALAAIGRAISPWAGRISSASSLIWFGFLLIYQVARGLADRNPAKAFSNGLGVIDLEKHVHGLFELTLQRITVNSHLLTTLTSWTYWMSQFTVLGLALLWVYLRRHEHFAKFRNTILLANVIGLIGYIALPTAPPRMFPRARVHGHDQRLRRQPRQRLRPVRGESLRRDAEPARRRRADRRRHLALVVKRCTSRCSGCSGRRGSGSRSWPRRTTSGSTSLPASCVAGHRGRDRVPSALQERHSQAAIVST